MTTNNTKTISLRLENELHKSIKLIAVNEETTIQQYLINLIEKDLKQRKERVKEEHEERQIENNY